jgi:hypothetical protein
MLERLSLDRHAQFVHVREVRCRQPAGFMHLSEKYLLGWTQRGPPSPHLPLQGPQLSVAIPTRSAALQFVEDRLRLQARLLLQQGTNLGPDLGEGIDPSLPCVRLGQFAG